jgi:hypothetical protein
MPAPMSSLALAAVLAFALILPHAAARAAGGRPSVPAFASQRVMGSSTGSYFKDIPAGTPRMNGCESALAAAMESRGFAAAATEHGDEARARARRHLAVFKRYRDVSAMSNDAAVRAATIVDADAVAVIICTASADYAAGSAGPGLKRACASASCKAISTKTRRRIATADERVCAEARDGQAAGAEAIRQACTQAGDELGGRILPRQEASR